MTSHIQQSASASAPSDTPRPESTPGRLVVSLVTWRAADLTIACLRTVAAEIDSLPDVRVIVVDNDSQDGSDKRVEQAIRDNGWDAWADFRRAPGNNGFAAGNNVAIREALQRDPGFDYLLLLNPDTLLRPDAFRLLVEFMDAHPRVGIAGGRSEDLDTTPQLCCFRFPNALSEFSLYLRVGLVDRLLNRFLTKVPIPEEPREIGWVSGALMIIRREVLDEIGLMDEDYFLYYEETDFTHRALRAGWTCWHVPQSRVVHLVGHSTGVTVQDERPPRRPRFWFESRHRYFVTNCGRLHAILIDALSILGFGVWRLRRWITRRPHRDPPHFFRDFIAHSVFVKGFSLPQTPDRFNPMGESLIDRGSPDAPSETEKPSP